MGIDIELPTNRIKKISHKFLNIEEREQFYVSGAWPPDTNNIPLTLNDKRLTVLWCAKEAVYKWWGAGGVDFKKDINIRSISGNADQGIVHCVFKNEISLNVHFLHFNDNVLTWVVTGH